MTKVTHGDKIKVHYTGSFDDGTVFDSSKDREPLEFTTGSGQVIPGFDQGVIGMELNEKKSLKIPAANAYGEFREDMFFKIPKKELPERLNPKSGQKMQMKNDKGQSFFVTVTEVHEDFIQIDANHPMAGKNLNFDIELIEIII